MKQDLKKLINKIWLRDKQEQVIILINQLAGDKRQQILKNPNYKTFTQYIKFNSIILEDDSQFSWWLDKYETEFEYNKNMWPYIFNNQYYINSEAVLLAFFRKYPKMRLEFLAKQTII